ncbi:hypothetical protein MBANPS3_012008 [Mucor bainieri]
MSLNVSNVKDYIARVVYAIEFGIKCDENDRNIATTTTTTTDSYTENTRPSIHGLNASSSSPFIEQNKSTSENSSTTMNDSLERIGTSLQLLIEEAQASLLTTTSTSTQQQQQQQQQQETDTLVDYSYRYVQHGYLQSQEKLALAIEKLEQSIHSVVYTASMQQQTIKNYYTTTTHHHHYYATTTTTTAPYPPSSASALSSSPSSSPPAPASFDRSKLWIMGIVLIISGYADPTCQNQHPPYATSKQTANKQTHPLMDGPPCHPFYAIPPCTIDQVDA